MIIVMVLILVMTLGISASAVYSLYWSAQDGQFTNLPEGAKTIFNENEPLGYFTDGFPGEKNPYAKEERV
jgi:nitrogen fixation-related uncharacterized protein